LLVLVLLTGIARFVFSLLAFNGDYTTDDR